MSNEDSFQFAVKSASFLQDIEKFNEMYRLPSPPVPSLTHERLGSFYRILGEELEEVSDIILSLEEDGKIKHSEILTDIADWLGDIVVYCVSEMRRYGLKPEKVLGIIMQSNFSKLGEDGKPIYDERGKVLKGPGYWKPEPQIKAYIESEIGEK